ncbi:hypothetical protein CL616_01915 [archaeon]|nr:hypothetical protein [archaeon]|tara:strand:- start:2199 stop:3182 length:984 start_codon:yes stop_codon:yes gene_type:complete
MSKKIEISRDYLEDLYINKHLTTFQIADIFGCCQATIWKRLHKYNILARPVGSPIDISKEEFEELYWNQKLSTWKIGELLGISRGTVHRKMRKMDIKIRNISESHVIYPKKDFDQDELFKAYLIGFSIGDLRVRFAGKEQSETIKVDCGSTKSAQIELIKEIFDPYGRVWISRVYEKGKQQIEASVNLSFSFLLNKQVPINYFKEKELFFAFLAGFTDAEGCIYLSRGKAAYALANCDYELLLNIKSSLEFFGIYCSNVNLSKKKGTLNSEGYPLNEDYWYFSVNQRFSLFELLYNLRKYSKHGDKRNAIEKGLINIINQKNLWKAI